MQRIDPERWKRSQRLARLLLLVPVPPVVYKPFDGTPEWCNGPPQPGFEPPKKLFRTWLRTNGQQARRSEYGDNPREINGGFHMPEALRGKPANDLINAALEPIRDYYSFINADGKRVPKPVLEWIDGWARLVYDLDRYSMWGFLKEIAGLDDETIEAIGTLENLTSRLPLSFFHSFLGRSDINPQATYWEIVGGTDRLTDTLERVVTEAGVTVVKGWRMIRLEYWHPDRDTSRCRHVGPDGPRVWIQTIQEKVKDGEEPECRPFTADRAIVSGLVALHGERILAFYCQGGATQSWLRNPYAFGEAAVFTPWQLTQFHLDIPTAEGPIHFAGEHTSLKHAWVEGALESAVRTALEVHGSAEEAES
jgi:hypothetical protein